MKLYFRINWFKNKIFLLFFLFLNFINLNSGPKSKIENFFINNRKNLLLGSVGLISALILKKILKNFIEIKKEALIFKKENVFQFLNESYNEISECNLVSEDERNNALITILNFSLPVIYIDKKNYSEKFKLNNKDIWINLFIEEKDKDINEYVNKLKTKRNYGKR